MNLLERFAGKACEVLLPIKHDMFYGNKKSNIAICTLSSIDLLEQISKSDLMNKVAIVARLFSENKGIEKLVAYVLQHNNIRYIILCGKDTKGHLPGQTLLALHRNGIDENGRVIGSNGKDPVVSLKKEEIDKFRKATHLIDLIGTAEIDEISMQVANLQKA